MRSNHQVERTGHQLRYWLHSSLHSSAAAHLDRWASIYDRAYTNSPTCSTATFPGVILTELRLMLALVFRAIALLALTACSTTAISPVVPKHVAVEGDKLAYIEVGKGAPLILVHGGLQDYRLWEPILGSLAERHRVIAYSRRNHFPNAVDAEGAPDGAADIHAKDLADLVRGLNLGPVHVVGHSSGAVTALHFAAAHRDLVRSMVLNEPPATSLLAKAPGGLAMLKEQGARLAPARDAFIVGDLQRAIRLFVDAIGGPGAFDRRPELGQRMALDNALSHRADNTSKRPRPAFTCEDAKKISAPVLLTRGAESSRFFHAIVDELERCLPRRESIVIPSASHTVPEEQPLQFADAVRAFLSNQRDRWASRMDRVPIP